MLHEINWNITISLDKLNRYMIKTHKYKINISKWTFEWNNAAASAAAVLRDMYKTQCAEVKRTIKKGSMSTIPLRLSNAGGTIGDCIVY